ncbi:hypothetical protein PS393_07475, partial [Limosilactobacillus fermentum]
LASGTLPLVLGLVIDVFHEKTPPSNYPYYNGLRNRFPGNWGGERKLTGQWVGNNLFMTPTF